MLITFLKFNKAPTVLKYEIRWGGIERQICSCNVCGQIGQSGSAYDRTMYIVHETGACKFRPKNLYPIYNLDY
jgi:hypothetical protein